MSPSEKLLYFAIGGFTAFCGLLIVLAQIWGHLKFKKTYTVTVLATCTGYEKKIFDPQTDESKLVLVSDPLKDPAPKAAIYSYEYNGQQYEYHSQYFGAPRVGVGSTRSFKINPNNPSESSGDSSTADRSIPMVVGLVFLMVGVALLYFGPRLSN